MPLKRNEIIRAIHGKPKIDTGWYRIDILLTTS